MRTDSKGRTHLPKIISFNLLSEKSGDDVAVSVSGCEVVFHTCDTDGEMSPDIKQVIDIQKSINEGLITEDEFNTAFGLIAKLFDVGVRG
jgi:hypothetical protein